MLVTDASARRPYRLVARRPTPDAPLPTPDSRLPTPYLHVPTDSLDRRAWTDRRRLQHHGGRRHLRAAGARGAVARDLGDLRVRRLCGGHAVHRARPSPWRRAACLGPAVPTPTPKRRSGRSSGSSAGPSCGSLTYWHRQRWWPACRPRSAPTRRCSTRPSPARRPDPGPRRAGVGQHPWRQAGHPRARGVDDCQARAAAVAGGRGHDGRRRRHVAVGPPCPTSGPSAGPRWC